jgi:hypothetical protein
MISAAVTAQNSRYAKFTSVSFATGRSEIQTTRTSCYPIHRHFASQMAYSVEFNKMYQYRHWSTHWSYFFQHMGSTLIPYEAHYRVNRLGVEAIQMVNFLKQHAEMGMGLYSSLNLTYDVWYPNNEYTVRTRPIDIGPVAKIAWHQPTNLWPLVWFLKGGISGFDIHTKGQLGLNNCSDDNFLKSGYRHAFVVGGVTVKLKKEKQVSNPFKISK